MQRKLRPAVWIGCCVLMSCAATPPPAIGPDAAPPEPEAGTAEQDAEPSPGTDSEVVYRVLAGELLGGRDDLEAAAREYLAAAMESEDPEIAERATRVAMAAQAWQHAAMAGDRWVVLQPGNPDARVAAARAMFMAGDYAGAEYQLSGYLALDHDDPLEAWRTVAELFQSARHVEKADKVLTTLVTDHAAADNPYALFAQSQMAVRAGDMPRAAELAEAAIRHAPEIADLHTWAGRLAINTGNEGAAEAHFRNAWALNPADRMNALLYAGVLRRMGHPERAGEVLSQLPDTPENRFTRIAFAVESGDRETAQALYEKFATAEYADPTEHALQAAHSAELLSLPEEAVHWYQKVGEGPEYLMAQLRGAMLLAQLGRVEEAREALAAARVNADAGVRIETLVTEAQILQEAHQPAAAFELLDNALEQFPDETGLLYSRALVAVELGRVETAERDLRRIIEREPGNAAALNALGYTLADRNERLDEAEQLISAAYELAPDEASIIDSMGWIAYRMGRLREAESYLREAFSQDRNAEIAAHLGEVLWMLDKHEDAQEVWSQGLEIDAENRVLRETLSRFGAQP